MEARLFLDMLVKRYGFGRDMYKDMKFLDLACGRGRHSVYLNSLGFDVTGADLSEASISHARKWENEKLRFIVHDMRKPLAEDTFDCILNLFTSFGYFENEQDHQDVLNAVAKSLKPGGLFVLDYLNVRKAKKNLVAQEQMEVDGIEFHISRKVENDFIVKNIEFEHKEKSYFFSEKIRTFRLSNFNPLFENAGLKMDFLYGNYEFKKYILQTSDRLILVARKPK